MNKIILNFGLLVFFISVVVFSQSGMKIQEILLHSFIIFVAITTLTSIIALVFIKSINKTSSEKGKQLNHKILGQKDDE